MAYKLSMLAAAENEYETAVNHYTERSVETARRFIGEVADALDALANNPTTYGYHFTPYRRVLLRSFPYKIVYEIDGGKVIIYSIYHASRNDAELRNRLP